MKVSKIKSRKGDSTVLSTIILVSVTVVLAFVTAFWISSITEQNMKIGKVEIQSGTCIWNSSATYWKIMLELKNTGDGTATLMSVFINDMEIATYDQDSVVENSTSTNMTTPMSITSGASVTINIYIDQGYASLSAHTTVNIKIHCSGGREYYKPIELS